MKVVMFATHTDDEMVCAGTLSKLHKNGHELVVVTFAPAATENDRLGTNYSYFKVKPEWEASMHLLGVEKHNQILYNIFLPSIDLTPHRQAICQRMFDLLEAQRFDIAFVPSPYDQNSGHATVGSAAEEVTRGRVKTVVRYQFPWNYGTPAPNFNLYVSLSSQELNVKRSVINCYQSQHFRYAYREMLMSYAQADGLSVKAVAAEKFELVRAVL
jgi:LmbE family N-acetylglucosaminyl deacetylase